MKPILFAVSGETPAIVTETLHELIRHHGADGAPQAIHIVTTTQGLDNLQRVLKLQTPAFEGAAECHFAGLQGELARLYAQMHAAADRVFDGLTVHVIGKENGPGLADIQSESDNLAAANTLLRVTRQLAADDDSVIHFSVAGGRKTMSYYMGMCANLLGRAQDTLSHVLAAPAFEQSQLLFPPAEVTAVEAMRRAGDLRRCPEPVMSDQALSLSVMPFIRLRPFLPLPFLSDPRFDYSAVVEGMNDLMGDPHITVSLPERAIILVGGIKLSLLPKSFAMYWLLASRRKSAAVSGVGTVSEKLPVRVFWEDYIEIYRLASNESGHFDIYIQDLPKTGTIFTKEIEDEIARINSELNNRLGKNAAQQIRPHRTSAHKAEIKEFALRLSPDRIALVR